MRAVSIRIGVRSLSARSTRHTVSPSTPGIITSSTTTSWRWSREHGQGFGSIARDHDLVALELECQLE